MKPELLAQWEKEAFAASDALCVKVDGLVTSKIELVTIPVVGADGTNSADDGYVERLINREHLTEGFLSDH